MKTNGLFRRKVSCIFTSVLDGGECSHFSRERSRRHILERISSECRSQTERGKGKKNFKDQTRSSSPSLHMSIIPFFFEYECTAFLRKGFSSLRMCVQLTQQRASCQSARLMEFLWTALSARRSRQMLRGAPYPVRGGSCFEESFFTRWVFGSVSSVWRLVLWATILGVRY